MAREPGPVVPGRVEFELGAPLQADRPTYPDFARDALIYGAIDLELQIDREGRTTNVVVQRGVSALNESAAEAAKRWRFAPAHPADSTGDPRIFKARVLYFIQRM